MRWNRKWHSPRSLPRNLTEELVSRIRVSGPLTVAEYMRQCLTHPKWGYYTTKKHVLGRSGDFVTAPEVSSMFGEMIAVWCATVWSNSFREAGPFRLIELGPGKGSLMRDVLRGFDRWGHQPEFGDLPKEVKVSMVEASPVLRTTQCELLRPWIDKISWHSTLGEVPEDVPVIVIAQEFFDALPVHQFVRKDRGWCERMVDLDPDSGAEFPLRYVMSRGETVAIEVCRPFLEEASGDEIEVSPLAIATLENICHRIQSCPFGGAALIVDYGEVKPRPSSLRAIRDHQLEPCLANPGNADLSADVDFCALIRTARGVRDIEAFGPVTQDTFLHSLGIRFRLDRLMAQSADDQSKGALEKSYVRLTHPSEMGALYKAIALVKKGMAVPPAFEGDGPVCG